MVSQCSGFRSGEWSADAVSADGLKKPSIHSKVAEASPGRVASAAGRVARAAGGLPDDSLLILSTELVTRPIEPAVEHIEHGGALALPAGCSVTSVHHNRSGASAAALVDAGNYDGDISRSHQRSASAAQPVYALPACRDPAAVRRAPPALHRRRASPSATGRPPSTSIPSAANSWTSRTQFGRAFSRAK